MKIINFIKDKALSASIAAYQLRGTVAKSLAVLPLALLSKEAAAETTIWEKINSFTEGLASTQPGLISGGKVIGVVCVIVGLVSLWLKNKRGKDISGSFIFWSMFVGACLVGLTAWISSLGSTVGVDATL
ncbi:conjugal transfer protein [Salmonella enterica subsp. enterica serovar Give]|nr:conjugal transfer protein [Salmonella enterica subsp. enterica serovar Give]ECA4141840.1 conjugal transfer protein [Salmonella enterica subsp. enterica serovar Give]